MKTIQIKTEEVSSSTPSRSDIPLTRREFLGGTAVLTGTLAMSSVLSLLAPSRSWAATMTTFDETQAKQMLRLTQVIFPHENMPDAINALAVGDFDGMAGGDEAVASSFVEGFKALDAAAGGNWLEAGADDQLAAVTANTDSALFTTVRGKCITSLYDNELAYEHFGYEGDAFGKGGYLFRGFDDLAWLPDPPDAASPAAI